MRLLNNGQLQILAEDDCHCLDGPGLHLLRMSELCSLELLFQVLGRFSGNGSIVSD
jgi:hypothetical protein